ncbi:hypothetical protein EUX98_g4978 [Antrodiella citrinella]|uniref:DUF6535 domain-containing protein n=1 Tax=Antrodiella citrinella TaxID=2447956 RepID=A0A4S4MV46_9APHY|nr:hypothetical protein EUX98_g4978 [Antrodiella citrinella]
MLEYVSTGRRRREASVDAATESPGWTILMEKGTAHDGRIMHNWNDEIETLLFFSGLFSAVITAFIIETYRLLQPDTDSMTVILLQQISAQLVLMANGTTSIALPPPLSQQTFEPTTSAVLINTLWFSSLVFSLVAASFGMLVRQWLREYADGQQSSPRAFTRIRQYRYRGLTRWGVFHIMAIVPVILQVALVLFLLGLVIFLRPLNFIVFFLVTILVGMWLSVYTFTTAAPAFFPDCPYKSPQARIFYMCVEHARLLFKNVLSVAFHWLSPLEEHRYKVVDLEETLTALEGDHEATPDAVITPHQHKATFTDASTWEVREINVRHSLESDIDALVGIDDQLRNDTYLEEILAPCLTNLSGVHVAQCITQILQSRLGISTKTRSGTPSVIALNDNLILEKMHSVPVAPLTTMTHILVDALDREVHLPISTKYDVVSTQPEDDSYLGLWVETALKFLSKAVLRLKNKKQEESDIERHKTKIDLFRKRFCVILLRMLRYPSRSNNRSLSSHAFECFTQDPTLLLPELSGAEALQINVTHLLSIILSTGKETAGTGKTATIPLRWATACLGLMSILPTEAVRRHAPAFATVIRKHTPHILASNLNAHAGGGDTGTDTSYPYVHLCHQFAQRLHHKSPGICDSLRPYLVLPDEQQEESPKTNVSMHSTLSGPR